jgi:hypothetical protein
MTLQLRVGLSERLGRRAAHAGQHTSSLGQPRVAGRQRRQLPRRWRRAQGTASALADSGGDERVQDGLVDMIHVQIGQQHVKSFFEDESDRLRRTAEEAKAEVDQLNQLELDRSTLAFGSAMADINQTADEFEQQLLAQRRENEADAAALVQWQRQMAVDRSRGHFFKSLYTADIEEEELDRLKPSTRKALAESQLVPAATEPSRAQLLGCAFLAGVLATAVAADALGPAPSWGQDALYLVMCLALGTAAWRQRGGL